MGDVARAAAAEGVPHRRIEFHPARRSHVAAAVGGGGFRLETLNPDADWGVPGPSAGSEGEGRRPEKREVGGGGLDPELELSVARFYLGRIGAGLQNLGNTCYLNSVLQCLTYTEPFAAYLQSGKHKSSCRTAGFCALCALQNHVRTALQSTGKIVTPSQFVKNLRCISRSFRNYRQEDAHELMVNLLESMHKCCLPSGVPSESPSAYEKSLVHKIFGGRLRSQVRCTRCSHCSNKFDPFLDLSLDIAKATTLVRALQKFTEEELLDGGEKQYQCHCCRQKVVAKKKFTIDKPPYVLTIHLKRFSPINPRVKIDKRVAFQPTLDLKPFVSDSEGTDFKYSLYGVLVHAGLTTQAGHYYCFVRTSSGMWHNLDDNKVRQVREADVLQQEAYMLFYVRDRVRSSRVCKDNGTANMSGKKMSEISYLNGVIDNDVIKTKLIGPSFTCRDTKLQNISNGHSSIISNTTAGRSSKNDGNTEGFEAAASQSNGMSSAQKAPLVHQNDGATFSTKSKQTALSCQKEIQSSGQPECPANASGSQKLGEMSTLELRPKADSAATHSGKNYVAASRIPNGAARLFETDKRTSKPQTNQLSEPTSCLNDTVVTAQIAPAKDGIISNGIISSSGGYANSEKVKNSAESQKQHGETVMVKELPMHQKNSTSSEVKRVNFERQICCEDSIRKVAADSGHGNRPKKRDLKSKKLVRYPVMNMCFGPKQLLITSLKLRKKRKHKRTKRQSMICKDVANIAGLDDNTNEQQTSTSGTILSETVECKCRGWKRAHASASSGNGSQTVTNTQQFSGASDGADDHNLDMKCSKNAAFVGAELPKLGLSSSANQPDSRNNADANGAVYQHVSLLTRGLTEVTVLSWDDNEKPNSKTVELTSSRSSSIGYVLDEWDEEYDRGRRKKVRQSKEDFGGPNPFQEKADIRSRKRMKLKVDQARSFNQPIRLEQLRI